MPRRSKCDAMAAWRRFVCCVRSLLADQAVPLWQAALAEAVSTARYIKAAPRRTPSTRGTFGSASNRSART
jgi:hypothetical protein